MKTLGLFLLTMFVIASVQAAELNVNADSINQVLREKKEVIRQSINDSILLQKLSPDQLMQLEREKIEVERQKNDANNKADMPLNGFGIVVICLMPFIFVILVVNILSKVRNQESIRKYELYTKSLEMGQAVPEHFFDEPKKANVASNLKKGILWLVVGLSLVISFVIINKNDALILGIVPTFVGIGYLLVHKLDKPKTEKTAQKDEQHG